MIETVKYDGGVTGDYMRLMEDEEYLRECAMQEGREVARIHAEGDLSILKTWLQYAARSTSLEEFLEKIEQNEILIHEPLKSYDFGGFLVPLGCEP